ncbi:hypothetical protein MY04_4551 [Flammeovirga sp. MY04]|uniref:hypothetical protein n=1 Tax=Flammeovirga sp. MY04 TaxID=1191459 RepID=UPI00080639CB|nr:hypothetical protein [Flammeovirga sp. MY04]ANQ51886.1 hypothetical protein MY04_4551 [Flammeovirga sp. MY04]
MKASKLIRLLSLSIFLIFFNSCYQEVEMIGELKVTTSVEPRDFAIFDNAIFSNPNGYSEYDAIILEENAHGTYTYQLNPGNYIVQYAGTYKYQTVQIQVGKTVEITLTEAP